MTKEVILGVDIGTSSIKVLFIDLEGTIVRREEEKLRTEYREGGFAEQNAMDYLESLRRISKKNADLMKDVIAIGLSGHTPSVVCVDAEGKPVRPVLTWQDTRATLEARELHNEFNNPLETVGTSLPWSASACPAKLYWLAKNELRTRDATRWVLQPKDFLGFHLTGKAISDPWSTKGMCNVLTKSPILNLLTFIGWGPEVVPELKDGYESRGVITPDASHYFGLPLGAPVSVGWSDAMSGMVAMGVMTEPTTFIITGTSAIVGASSLTPPEDGDQLYVIPNTCSPLSVTYGPTQSSGSSVEWASKIFNLSSDEIVDLAVVSNSERLPIYLPYIDGERAPLWRPDIRGGFYGVSISSTREDFAASVLEGTGFAERQVLEIAEKLNRTSAPAIKLGGYAGNDDRGEKFRLRTLGRPIERFKDTDTTTRGSAVLALTVVTQDLVDSAKRLSYTPHRIEPSLDDRRYSEKKYLEFLLAQKHALALADQDKE